MERVFSVDDILGTFWKLDTQGDNPQPNQINHFGSQLDLQKLYQQPGPPNVVPLGGGMAHSTSFHRMNRSSSEWAFQEFLKEHVSPNGRKQRKYEEGKAGVCDDSDSQKSASDDENDRVVGHGSERNTELQQENSHEGIPESAYAGRSLQEGVSVSREQYPDAASQKPVNPGTKVEEISQSLQQTGGGDSAPNMTDDVDGTGPQQVYQLPPGGPTQDPQDYENMLKQQLAAACAMAKTRVRSGASPTTGPVLSRPQPVHPGMNYPPIPHYGMHHSYMPPYLHGGMPMPEGSVHPHSSDTMIPTSVGQVSPIVPQSDSKSANHARGVHVTPAGPSSREHSDDDDLKSEGEAELVASLEHVTDPEEIKRIKRMLSNRESARRSRRRKQAHLSDLEAQVSHLQAENTSLSNRLTDIGRKYNEAAVDNRVLKSDVEALRAKVKMAEEMVSRGHHMSQYLYGGPHHPPSQYRPSSEAPSHAAPGEAPFYPRPLRPGQMSPPPPSSSNEMQAQGHNHHPPHIPPALTHFMHHPHGMPIPPRSGHPHHPYGHLPHDLGPPPHIPGSSSPPQMPGDLSGMGSLRMERSPSMQRVASLEHLQKRIRGPAVGAWGVWEDPSVMALSAGGHNFSSVREGGTDNKDGDPKENAV